MLMRTHAGIHAAWARQAAVREPAFSNERAGFIARPPGSRRGSNVHVEALDQSPDGVIRETLICNIQAVLGFDVIPQLHDAVGHGFASLRSHLGQRRLGKVVFFFYRGQSRTGGRPN